jgi:predicted amidophosphoribosyltransferase
MSHVQCPSCGARLRAIGAPDHCPRCLERRRGRFKLVPASIFDPPPSQVLAGAPRSFCADGDLRLSESAKTTLAS